MYQYKKPEHMEDYKRLFIRKGGRGQHIYTAKGVKPKQLVSEDGEAVKVLIDPSMLLELLADKNCGATLVFSDTKHPVMVVSNKRLLEFKGPGNVSVKIEDDTLLS